MKVVGVILAGGQATRMGGGDKGLLELGGVRLLNRVIGRLGPQVEAMCLNANGDPARFDGFGLPVVADTVEGFAGPLAGVLAGMDWAAGEGASHVVSAAADTPFFFRAIWWRGSSPVGPALRPCWPPCARRGGCGGSRPSGFGRLRCEMTCGPRWRAVCARWCIGPSGMTGARLSLSHPTPSST